MKKLLILLLFIPFMFSCRSFPKSECPYLIENIRLEKNGTDYIESELYVCFENFSEKTIRSFTLAVEFFQENEEISDYFRNSIQLEYNGMLGGNSLNDIYLPFSDYVFDGEENELLVESAYVKEIIYADGTKWLDRYGIFAR